MLDLYFFNKNKTNVETANNQSRVLWRLECSYYCLSAKRWRAITKDCAATTLLLLKGSEELENDRNDIEAEFQYDSSDRIRRGTNSRVVKIVLCMRAIRVRVQRKKDKLEMKKKHSTVCGILISRKTRLLMQRELEML